MYEVPLEDLPVGAVVLDADATVVAVNEAAAAALGRETGDLVGEPLAGCVAPGDRSAVAALVDEVRAGRRPELVAALDAVPPRWVELSGSTTAGGLLVTVRDATEQVRTFRVLRESVQVALIADDEAERVWGPVGRAHPEDRPGQATGSLAERIHPEDASAAAELWSSVRAEPGGHGRLMIRARMPGTDDEWGLVTFEVRNLTDVPAIGGLLVTLVDQQAQERVTSLGRTRGSFLSIAEAAPVGIILGGPRGLPIYFNEASQRLVPGIGMGGDDAGRDWIGFVRADERDEVRAWVAALVDAAREDSRLVCFDGDHARAEGRGPTWSVVTVAPRITDEGSLVGFVITLQDVTSEIEVRHELEAAQERLVHLATHDTLTGLANRSRLADVLAGLRAGHPAGAATSVGVLFADLDGFKAVNDMHGHHVGDEVLVAVADRLRRACEPEDLVARIGGDEFLVLVSGAEPDALEARGRRMAGAVAEPIEASEVEIRIGVSVGTAMLGPEESIDELLRRADAAMYARKAGRRADDVVTSG